MEVTLITGASGGIGEAFARRLAAEGQNLLLIARSEERLHALCDELMLEHKVDAHYLALDITAAGSLDRIVEETDKHGYEVDWLINNAGFGSMGDFCELDINKELEMIDLNISALVALTHSFLGPMRRRRRGTIINVSSSAGFQPVPFMSTYAATKAFVTSFSEAIAEENRPFGILVSVLCPGPTKTNFFAASNIDDPFTVKGMQTAEEVVNAALKGVAAGKARVISGWVNHVSALLGTVVPDSLITRVVASKLRSKYQTK